MITVVTTFANRHWDTHAKRCVETLWKHWPACVDKFVYVNDGIPSELTQMPVRVIDMDRMEAIEKFRDQFGDIVRKKLSESEFYDYRFDALRFFYKLAALFEASTKVQGKLIWLDADTETKKDVPLEFLESLSNGDVSYLDREKYGPECGFVVYDLDKKGRDFIWNMMETYCTGYVFEMDEWHDSYVFGKLLRGFDAHQIVCGPEKHIWQHSPLQEYITHYKGPVRKREMQDLPDSEVLKEPESVKISTGL